MEGDYAYAGFGIWQNTSTIVQAFDNAWSADPFVARILAEPETGLYWTLLINPDEGERGFDQTFGGVLTIGQIANLSQIFNVPEEDLQQYKFPDFRLVTEYPILNNSASYNGCNYYVVIDAISWGNGSATLNSTIPGIPHGKVGAYIDSTYPWIQAPYAVTEKLYKDLEGATYAKDTGLWHLQCTELAVNITIAGHDYPLNPLTTTQHVDGLNCVGTVSHASTPAVGTFTHIFLGSSKPSQITLEVILSLAFPSVRPHN